MVSSASSSGTVWVGRLAVLLYGLGFAWAAVGSLRLLTTEPYLGVVTEAAGRPHPTIGRITVSLASANGPWIVGLLSLVTILVGVPFGVALTLPKSQRWVGWTVGLLLLGFSLISGFSVGLTYLPATLLILTAAALSPRSRYGHGAG